MLTGGSLFAGTIPIPVSGSGTWGCDRQDAVFAYTLSFSGTNGTDTISANYSGEVALSCVYNSSTLGGSELGSVSLDGQSSFNFNAVVGGGGGQLTLFDNSSHLLAQVNVVAYLSYTYIQDDPEDSHGNITISSTPEPLTGAMMLIGISALAMLRRLRRSRQHIR